MTFRRYSSLRQLHTFEDRFAYLKLNGGVSKETFGFDRHINQSFYHSLEWNQTRNFVITRDLGCDLGIPGYEIQTELLVHHMEPMTKDDIIHGEDWILDPEYLITTCHSTHNAIHYGNALLSPRVHVDRSPGDTKLW